jgi:RimJ/RimL family protein N-acetyltransferase
MPIAPHPHHQPIVLADGRALRVRPITSGDRDALDAGFRRLSARTRARRFLSPKHELSSRELRHLTEIDHQSHEALVAIDPVAGEGVAVARYAAWPDRPGVADVAVTVVDAWQGRGVGTALCQRLLGRAREEGIERLTATTMSDNSAARALLARLGFRTRGTSQGVTDLELQLAGRPLALAA